MKMSRKHAKRLVFVVTNCFVIEKPMNLLNAGPNRLQSPKWQMRDTRASIL